MMHMTDHAAIRMQQRGIRRETVMTLLAFGRRAHDRQGATIYFFDRAARTRLARTLGKGCERQLDAYVVVGGDGAVITVGHRSKRLLRH